MKWLEDQTSENHVTRPHVVLLDLRLPKVDGMDVLAVRADVPDDAVYEITRSIWENLSALHEIHKATREMSLDKALDGLGAPLHPGAARYYREKGLEIPQALTPP